MDKDRGADVPAGAESGKAPKGVPIQAILSSLGVFLIAVLVLAIMFFNAQKNSEKVKDLTRACIEAGYQGWSDEDDVWTDSTRSGCFK